MTRRAAVRVLAAMAILGSVVPAAGHSVQNRAAGNHAEAAVARFLTA